MLHGMTGTSNAEDGDDVYLQSFDVRFEYPVHFTRDLFDPENGTLADSIARLEPSLRHRVAVLIDNSVSAAMPILADRIARYFGRHANRLELVSPPETVPGGEVVKNAPALVDRLQRRLLDWRVDRHCAIVAIRGGAMLDIVGFVAATFHRGVRLVRVPTTVLAQDDSGVGVKSGINSLGVKNLVGSFAPPFAVLNDFDFLLTLDPRDKIAGMAEAVKVALIRDDAFF